MYTYVHVVLMYYCVYVCVCVCLQAGGIILFVISAVSVGIIEENEILDEVRKYGQFIICAHIHYIICTSIILCIRYCWILSLHMVVLLQVSCRPIAHNVLRHFPQHFIISYIFTNSCGV